MKMVTTCPACETSFRVTPQLLQAHQGTVRCGRCGQVFDAFQTLSGAPESVPETVIGSAAEAATNARAPEGPTGPPFEPAPQFIMPTASAKPKQRGLALAVGLMATALVVQAIYFWRNEISASFPKLQGSLERTCAILHCTVALPQRPHDLTVEGSDMEAPDPATPGFLTLTATLRNRAPTAVGYPALDVALTNGDDHTVARRIFLPQDYLSDNRTVRIGIAPDTEITVRLNLDTGDLGATGFRIDLLPAP